MWPKLKEQLPLLVILALIIGGTAYYANTRIAALQAAQQEELANLRQQHAAELQASAEQTRRQIDAVNTLLKDAIEKRSAEAFMTQEEFAKTNEAKVNQLADAIAQNIADYRAQNGLGTNDVVPADAVTASGSGLDPHISTHNAQLQAPRVAKTRNLPLDKVLELVRLNTDPPSLGLFGEAGVTVLRLNLALDHLGAPSP